MMPPAVPTAPASTPAPSKTREPSVEITSGIAPSAPPGLLPHLGNGFRRPREAGQVAPHVVEVLAHPRAVAAMDSTDEDLAVPDRQPR